MLHLLKPYFLLLKIVITGVQFITSCGMVVTLTTALSVHLHYAGETLTH